VTILGISACLTLGGNHQTTTDDSEPNSKASAG